MITIDLTKPIVCEKDRNEGFCIDCFSPKIGAYFYFYNGHGPFCCKKCYANFAEVAYDTLPKLEHRGSIK